MVTRDDVLPIPRKTVLWVIIKSSDQAWEQLAHCELKAEGTAQQERRSEEEGYCVKDISLWCVVYHMLAVDCSGRCVFKYGLR